MTHCLHHQDDITLVNAISHTQSSVNNRLVQSFHSSPSTRFPAGNHPTHQRVKTPRGTPAKNRQQVSGLLSIVLPRHPGGKSPKDINDEDAKCRARVNLSARHRSSGLKKASYNAPSLASRREGLTRDFKL